MFKFDDSELIKYQDRLLDMNKRALPFATKAALNNAAFAGRTLWQHEIGREFIERNKFTRGSIRVEQARGLNIDRQEAVLGSVAPYMEDAEFGATKGSKGKHGVAIATSYSAGQGESTEPRTRLPRKPNKLPNIKLRHRRHKGSRRQRNLVAVLDAVQTGSKYVYLNTGRRKGIFKVVGGKRNPKVKMVHDLSRQSVSIPATPTMRPAVNRVEPMLVGFYKKAIKFQLARLR